MIVDLRVIASPALLLPTLTDPLWRLLHAVARQIAQVRLFCNRIVACVDLERLVASAYPQRRVVAPADEQLIVDAFEVAIQRH